jgi:hypothetical protein
LFFVLSSDPNASVGKSENSNGLIRISLNSFH